MARLTKWFVAIHRISHSMVTKEEIAALQNWNLVVYKFWLRGKYEFGDKRVYKRKLLSSEGDEEEDMEPEGAEVPAVGEEEEVEEGEVL